MPACQHPVVFVCFLSYGFVFIFFVFVHYFSVSQPGSPLSKGEFTTILSFSPAGCFSGILCCEQRNTYTNPSNSTHITQNKTHYLAPGLSPSDFTLLLKFPSFQPLFFPLSPLPPPHLFSIFRFDSIKASVVINVKRYPQTQQVTLGRRYLLHFRDVNNHTSRGVVKISLSVT